MQSLASLLNFCTHDELTYCTTYYYAYMQSHSCPRHIQGAVPLFLLKWWEGEKSELRLQTSAATAGAAEGALIHTDDALHHRMPSGAITNITQLLVQYKNVCKISACSRVLISNYAQNSNLVKVTVLPFIGETGSYRIRCRLRWTTAARRRERLREKFPILFMQAT